jgi:hypothetical protein
MKRRRFLFVALLIVMVVLSLGVCLLPPRTAITRDNAERIRLGMTLADVEEILGGPERDETTGPTERDPNFDGPEFNQEYLAGKPDPSMYAWQADRVAILVLIGPDNRVVDFAIRLSRRTQETMLDMLRRWLRL